MKWLTFAQAFLTLSPEVLALVAAIASAVHAAPPEHKEAVIQAVANAAAKEPAPGA